MKALKNAHAFWLFPLFIATIFFISCNDTDDGNYIKPITLYEKVNGHWLLNSIKQVDEISGQSISLTDQFDFSSLNIELNTDSDDNPQTYIIHGSAPALLPVSGYWSMEYPFINADGSANKIVFYNDANLTAKSAELTITTLPGNNNILEFKFTRKTQGQPFVSYVYNFISLNID